MVYGLQAKCGKVCRVGERLDNVGEGTSARCRMCADMLHEVGCIHRVVMMNVFSARLHTSRYGVHLVEGTVGRGSLRKGRGKGGSPPVKRWWEGTQLSV